jgi:hypothetical protein
MSSKSACDKAIESLDRLYLSRTGEENSQAPKGNSDKERRALLKRRICEEKILPMFREVLHIKMRKRKGEHYSIDIEKLSPDEIGEAVVETAELFLAHPELEMFRRVDAAEKSAYYNLESNEKLPSDEEDLFADIQNMQRRIICDSNLPLPHPMNSQYAFILGQTFDHEGDFWLRAQVKRGNENLFAFGVTEYQHCFPCLEIQRLRKEAIAAIIKRKASIPKARTHYSSASRLEEIQVIIGHYVLGKESLAKEISDLQTYYCPGSYQMSYFISRRCAALLLHEDAPELKLKIAEEWPKFLGNHPNVLGDTQLIQNALYFNAEILTKDKGAKRMADYCGLNCIEAVIS